MLRFLYDFYSVPYALQLTKSTTVDNSTFVSAVKKTHSRQKKGKVNYIFPLSELVIFPNGTSRYDFENLNPKTDEQCMCRGAVMFHFGTFLNFHEAIFCADYFVNHK